MAESIPTQIAETIQTAHIQRAPSPRHDLNPSSSMSEKRPVRLSSSSSRHHRRRSHDSIDDVDDIDDGDDEDEDDDEDIPISVLRPRPRTRSFPPMPDLRFEQSYLHSISKADTWWRVGWITVRDQMMMPFAQGVLYNLAICGWHHWNKNARLSGNSTGARLRRWWYGVNKWPLPASAKSSQTQTQGRSRQIQFLTTQQQQQQQQAKPWSSFSFDAVVRFLERYEREAARICQGWASAWKGTSST